MKPKQPENSPTGFSVRLSTKGQLVVPKEIRMRHGWSAGVELIFEDLGDQVVLREALELPETSLEDLIGCAGYRGPVRTLEQMEEGIAEGARQRR